MGVYGVSLANRRTIFLAVLSLIASLLAFGFNAPAANADDELVSFVAAGPTNVAEEIGTVDLDIEVTSTGTFVGPVTFDITTGGSATLGDDYSLSATDFTFSAAETQTLTVTINNNTTYEGDEDIVLGFANILPVTAGPGTNSTHTINISDSVDEPSISIDSPSAVTEGSPITFTATRSGPSEVGITFNAVSADVSTEPGDYSETWSNPITLPGGGGDSVTFDVNTTADAIYENTETFTVELQSITGASSGTTTGTGTITNADAAPTISIDAPGPETEGTPITFTVTRSKASEVDITFAADITDVSTLPADYTQTWSNPITLPGGGADSVTFDVNTIADGLFEGASETFTVDITPVSGATAGSPTTSTGTINDGDGLPTLSINSPAAVTEGTPVTFRVTRSGSTTSDVTFDATITPGTASGLDYTEAFTNPLTITAAGPGYVDFAVNTTDDDLDEGTSESFTVDITPVSGATAGSPTTSTGTINDDDTKGVTIDIGDGVSPSESGGTDTYTVVLTSKPTAAVTITVSSPGAQVTAVPSTLTFTSGPTSNWDEPQTVTVTAIPDDVDDGDLVETITHGVSGGDYSTGVTVADVDATALDDDVRGVTLTPLTVPVTEGGADGTYSFVLNSEPTAAVTITVTGDSQATAAPGTLTFTAGPTSNWDVEQFVRITAVDDPLIEAQPHTGTISHTAAGGDYAGLTIPDVEAEITDDDSAGVEIDTLDGVTVTEASGPGNSDTYRMRLTTQPSSDVTIFVADTSTEYGRSPTSLTFTGGPTGNWDTFQTVTVTGTDDDVDDGNTTPSITHSVTSGDADYDGLSVPAVVVSVIDDDEVGVTVVESGGSTDVIEGADTDTYTLVLDAEPGSDVVISISTDGQTAVSPSVVTFTPANWDVEQTVTVSGVEDGIDEVPSHPSVIQHTAAGDPSFVGVTIDDVVANVGDADALLVAIDGPTFGAPGKSSSFMAMVNAGGTGPITYDWTVFFQGNVIADGDAAAFQFTPTEGGAYIISAIVGDTQGQNPAVFINFTALGDIGSSVFVDDIIWLAEEGITRGCNPPDNDEFCPEKTVTRGQMAAFLVRFLDLTAIDPTIGFTDTDGNIFEQDILKLATAGITRGCNADGTEFCPDRGVTRGQMAAFLVRAFGLTDNGGGDLFDDDDASIFEDDIDKLATAGITRGCNPPDNTNFCPDRTVTRGQMAAFLHRAEPLVGP